MTDMTDEHLIGERIKEPAQPGDHEARLRNTGIPVWALIDYLKAARNNLETVAAAHEVPVDDVRAAVAYYKRHRDSIDARLQANAA